MTNFDDDYEENVTEFTSNEIRFKFNSNSQTTTIDYEFCFTKVEGITFTHNYSTTDAGESVFVPNVYVTTILMILITTTLRICLIVIVIMMIVMI
ncbi:MAG: hypothetical protein CM15mP92_0170 [Halieaceae bacterium]|nr:MAG: hypothetical protein CM15mP92_0170 [Halieaceae bacterium]